MVAEELQPPDGDQAKAGLVDQDDRSVSQLAEQGQSREFDEHIEKQRIEQLCKDFCDIQDMIIQAIRYYADVGDLITAAFMLMVFYEETLQIVPELSFGLDTILKSHSP